MFVSFGYSCCVAVRGDTWKPRFCAVNKGRLFLYQDHDDKEAKKIIQLDGATVRRSDNMYKRPCVQIIYSAGTAGKQSLVLSSEDDDIGVWKYVLDTEGLLLCVHDGYLAESGVGASAENQNFHGWLKVQEFYMYLFRIVGYDW